METLVNRPLARTTDFTVESLPDETVVYDHTRHRVHCLNRTLTFVLQQCDGQTSIQEIAQRLPDGVGLPPDEDVVLLAIRQLRRIHMIVDDQSGGVAGAAPSRRELVRKLAIAGTSVPILLPSLSSIVAPTSAMAASGEIHPDNRGTGGKGHRRTRPKEEAEARDAEGS